MATREVPAAPVGISFPALALARSEVRIGLRSAAFRFAAAGAFALGWSVGGSLGRGVSFSAYATGEAAWKYLGLVAVAWMAMTAVRDTALRTEVMVYSKPQPTERLALAKFLGAFGQLMLLLLVLFVGAMCGRLYAAGGLAGFPAYGTQFLRAVVVLFFASSAAYCLALLTESAGAGALVGLYWIVTLAGREYLAKIYFPAYTQNLLFYTFVSLFLLGLALWFHRRRRRGATAPALWLRAGVLLSVPLAAWAGWVIMRDGHDPQIRTNSILERIEEQTVTQGERAPGFLLPDQNGRQIGLSDFPDRILLIALWSPRDLESSLMLARLNALHARYGARGVQPIAVCISEDVGAGTTFARGESLSYPVVTDWGAYNATRQNPETTMDSVSPMTSAYETTTLPKVFVTDRRRRIRAVIDGPSTYDGPALEEEIAQRLREEPE